MFRRLTALALGLLLLVGAVPGPAQESKGPSVQEIMREANKPTGLFFTLLRDLKDPRPDWADSLATARELTALAEALTRTTPGKGDAASWRGQTAEYLTQVRALQQAVQKRDKAAALAVGTRLSPTMCTNCHKIHR